MVGVMVLLVEDNLQTQRASRMIGLVDLHVEDDLQMLNVGQVLGLMNHLVDLHVLKAGQAAGLNDLLCGRRSSDVDG